MLRKSLVCLLAAFAVTGLAQAQTADELIAKNIQAHGGLDKIKSVQTMRMTGKITGGGMEIEDQADIDGPLVDYKEKGHQVEYLGKVDTEGTPAHKLKVTKKNGDVVTIYLDADAFLEIKAEGKTTRRGQEVEVESTFGDYKDAGGGLVLAHSIEIKPKGMPQSQHIVIEKVELNPEIAADRFVMPPAKDAAPSS